MATATKAAQIVRTPWVRAAKARIEGTRICVVDVVARHKAGASSAQILEERTIPRPFVSPVL
jgi:uncharacterized protein (DUF433 family)